MIHGWSQDGSGSLVNVGVPGCSMANGVFQKPAPFNVEWVAIHPPVRDMAFSERCWFSTVESVAGIVGIRALDNSEQRMPGLDWNADNTCLDMPQDWILSLRQAAFAAFCQGLSASPAPIFPKGQPIAAKFGHGNGCARFTLPVRGRYALLPPRIPEPEHLGSLHHATGRGP